MRRPSSAPRSPYDSCARKTLHSALCHLLRTEFPGVFGPAITRLFADRITEIVERFLPPQARFKMGQVLWTAVAVDDPPARGKRIEDTRLIPVVLDLVTAQDIDDAASTGLGVRRRHEKVLRLFRQAFDQGAVLGLPDVSLLTNHSINGISRIVVGHERRTGETVPRRGTIHDMGRSVTHKAVICYKRLVERKPTSQVAQETLHSTDEVEYYVQTFRRIQLCRDSGMSEEDTAHATGHSLSLVREYLNLIKEFDLPPLPNHPGEGSVQSNDR
jgi:Protein of unknown function (DUF1670)